MIATEADLAEWIQDNWSELARTATAVKHASNTLTYISFELGDLRVLLRLVIGRRNSLTLTILVYDPEPPILADRMVCWGKPLNSDSPIDLNDLGARIREGADPVETCLAALTALANRATRNPVRWGRVLRMTEVASDSVRAVSGGLPGSNRRSRGVRRPRG